jgi:hypothetical protein
MDLRVKLRRALDSVESAQYRLRKIKRVLDDRTDINQAMYELDAVESEIKKALNELPKEIR